MLVVLLKRPRTGFVSRCLCHCCWRKSVTNESRISQLVESDSPTERSLLWVHSIQMEQSYTTWTIDTVCKRFFHISLSHSTTFLLDTCFVVQYHSNAPTNSNTCEEIYFDWLRRCRVARAWRLCTKVTKRSDLMAQLDSEACIICKTLSRRYVNDGLLNPCLGNKRSLFCYVNDISQRVGYKITIVLIIWLELGHWLVLLMSYHVSRLVPRL